MIDNKTLVKLYLRNLIPIKEYGDINSEAFDIAVSIEQCIEDLYTKGFISDLEIEIIKLIITGYDYAKIADKLKVNRIRVSKVFDNICRKVAFILGDIFYIGEIYD